MSNPFTIPFALIMMAITYTEPVNVGNKKQLFIDHKFIESSENVRLTMNPPRKYGPVIQSDRPWERIATSGYLTVIDDNGMLKMYYRGWENLKKHYTCLATSRDGIHWEKPNLGLVDYKGSKKNNILPRCGTPFIDPKAPPRERFRGLCLVYKNKPLEECGVFLVSSPDGIHWDEQAIRVLPFGPDTQNQVFYDTRLNKYVAYLRSWDPLRKVVRCEIDNLLAPWPYTPIAKSRHLWGKDRPAVPSKEMPTALEYDIYDPLETDIYTPCVFQYPWADDAYFAFPSMYYHFPEPPIGKYGNDGLLDIQLAVSRNGIRFHRPDRRPYVELGPYGDNDSGQIYMGIGVVRIGKEIYQYYGGYSFTHGEYTDKPDLKNAGAVYLVIQRLDGFMSADAAYQGGILTTPTIKFSGRRLVLNVNTSALGQVCVEILGADGLPIEGFSASDCEPIRGNHIAKVVTYGGKDNISNLAGKPIRLYFIMRSAKLYSFQFTDALSGAQ